ncbi:MAG: GTPase HflX [Candidatus Nitrohelix vancouverensis]|uniref:GTPase HflX n=1 Tax=Candidatus Nitrohelix vancouverensis TaxID=2705534 RepID=A0A7T0C069_9BACT|nr:MAG: GTPase HflX [Candidatus Nitrohelix vancouverensis]
MNAPLAKNVSSPDSEKLILIGAEQPGAQGLSLEASLEELEGLAITAGYEPAAWMKQNLSRVNPGTFLGKGKLEELETAILHHEADGVVFDDALSPTQNRNLEKILKCRVFDRPWLILEIFSRHAKTRAAKTQVELARLKYSLPRLSKMWSHLSRQRGGIGMKDVGETQIQLDRRMVREQISKLERKLVTLDKEKKTQNKRRQSAFTVSLVGYTNVGKSSLMNRLTEAGALAENKLFATLDATVRKIKRNHPYPILLTDTVGLINKLPHDLVASFKSTLDEVRNADLLINVVDISHPHYQEQMRVTTELLKELNADSIDSILVLNKIDALSPSERTDAENRHPDALFISCKTGNGVDAVRSAIDARYESQLISCQVDLKYSQMKALSEIRKLGLITGEDYGEEIVSLQVQLFPQHKERLRRLLEEI